ncbi:TIGR03503 family protein [Cognaticolwellia mytili]|uniref:TIGR03503 family protein n=1 Tax=Cognaticolwellia mytili TaxID=1888913 RepID=UPI001F31C306|nr:TIGR03503 family protein [Cognaticolwellia mytili]
MAEIGTEKEIMAEVVMVDTKITASSIPALNAIKKSAFKMISSLNQASASNVIAGFILAVAATLSVNAQQLKGEIDYYEGDNVTNQIPYFDNRFRIDAELEEVTFLFYRRSGTPPVILVRPDGSKLKINTAPKDKVQWFDDRTFDMIKIKSPMIGPWQVIGQVEHNSKIMVVSEIKLEVTPIPNIILQGETLKMEGRLFNGELAIDNPAFNDVLVLDVDFFSTNNANFDNFGAEPIKLASFRDDGRDLDEHANDSLFTGEFELDFAPGEWEPIYIIKMPMATRELRQTPIIVQKNPITISVETTQNKKGFHVVTFAIDESYVLADSVLIQGKITFPDRQVEPFSVMEGKGKSRIHNIAFTEPGIHRVKISVFGETTSGREFRAKVSEFSFNVEGIDGPLVPSLNGTELSTEQKNARAIADAEKLAEKLKQELAQAKAVQEAEIAAKQQETMIYIVAGNMLVVLLAGILFLVMRRKKTKK